MNGATAARLPGERLRSSVNDQEFLMTPDYVRRIGILPVRSRSGSGAQYRLPLFWSGRKYRPDHPHHKRNGRQRLSGRGLAGKKVRAADLTTSKPPLKDDDKAYKIMQCDQFLAQMFSGGTFQDDAACLRMMQRVVKA